MAKDPGFKFYPGDYLRDTQCLSEKSQVAYDRIMCEHMRNICISHAQLKFFTKKLSPEEIEELMMVLTEVEGGVQIEWIVASILKSKEYSKSRSENRSEKNKKTSNTHEEDMKTYVNHMDNDNDNDNNREKGVQGERRETGKLEGPQANSNINYLVYDVEKDLQQPENRGRWEGILMKTRKTEKIGLQVLRKYHLWVTTKGSYPMAREALFAGFELFLMNEQSLRNDKNNTDGNNTAAHIGKTIRFDKP